MTEQLEKRFAFRDSREMVAVLGENDEYLRLLQQQLDCTLIPRGNELIASGSEEAVGYTEKLVSELLYLYRQGLPVTEHDVKYGLRLVLEGKESQLHTLYTDTVLTTFRGKQVKAKTLGQLQYLKTIWGK